jgi:predicted Zn-dependent protease
VPQRYYLVPPRHAPGRLARLARKERKRAADTMASILTRYLPDRMAARLSMPMEGKGARFRRRLRGIVVGTLCFSLAATGTGNAAGLIRDAETEGLIRSYANPILDAAGLGGQGVRVHIVNDRAFNAFVIDGQNMFIHAGALMESKTPNQIIGVIAHESGHITGGHLARLRTQMSRARSAALMMQILGLAAMAAGAAAGVSAVGQVGMGAAMGGGDAAMRMMLAYRQDEESSADQAAISFLNQTRQSGRGLLETLEFMNAKLLGMKGINPYLQTHPLPPQRISQLQTLVDQSPYVNNIDAPSLQVRHDLMKAKLFGFLDKPETVFNRYPPKDQSVPAIYARAIATYRKSGVEAAMPQLDALIAAKPESPYFHELKGQFLYESGKPKAALPSLREAVRLAPNEPLIRIMLAQALLAAPDAKNLEEAITSLKTALARESTSSTGYRLLGQAYAQKAESAPGAARQHLMSQASLAAAESYFYQGQLKLAKQQAQRAKAGFVDGTPNWLRADDIVSFEMPKTD